MAAVDISPLEASMISHSLFEHKDAYQKPLEGPGIIHKHLFTELIEDIESSRSLSTTRSSTKTTPGLFITGLGSQYPPFLLHPDKLESFIEKWYDLETPA